MEEVAELFRVSRSYPLKLTFANTPIYRNSRPP